jgi:hypothetical protein
VKYVTGTPCTSNGVTHTNNTATVEMSGDYSCTGLSTNTGATLNIENGVFDGMYQLVDSCVGGGGGGSGGIPPIDL